jgi:hypothetical protein
MLGRSQYDRNIAPSRRVRGVRRSPREPSALGPDTGRSVRSEAILPALLAAALAARRAEQPDRTLQVVAFRVLRDGQEIARVGPAQAQGPLSELVALSVVVINADSTGLHVDAYTLAARDHRA